MRRKAIVDKLRATTEQLVLGTPPTHNWKVAALSFLDWARSALQWANARATANPRRDFKEWLEAALMRGANKAHALTKQWAEGSAPDWSGGLAAKRPRECMSPRVPGQGLRRSGVATPMMGDRCRGR